MEFPLIQIFLGYGWEEELFYPVALNQTFETMHIYWVRQIDLKLVQIAIDLVVKV